MIDYHSFAIEAIADPSGPSGIRFVAPDPTATVVLAFGPGPFRLVEPSYPRLYDPEELIVRRLG